MKEKTFLKLQRQFLALPLHHIDTSLIEEPDTTETGRQCRKYLNVVGYNYRGKFSLPALGELLLKIIYKLKIVHERYSALDVITNWIENKNIELYVPKNIGGLINEIKTHDTRIKETDAQILACAIEDHSKIFVTLDADLIGNKTLEREFSIKIRHPEKLI